MKRTLSLIIAAGLLSSAAFAEGAKPGDAATTNKPAGAVIEKSGTDATKEVGKAVPQMTKPDKDAQPPTARVGDAVPPMTADDKAKADAQKPGETKPAQPK